jgi:hypothetical protein
MVQRTSGRKMYRTANGKSIDLDLLIQRNELTPAVGNARVNARGDELGPGGKIIRKREEILRDYYQSTETLPSENIKPKQATEPVATTVSTVETPPENFDEGWEEDNEGNFIKKGKR